MKIALNSAYQKKITRGTKSQRDLSNQVYRIVHLSKDPDNDPRVMRAIETADRYQENMMNTRQRAKDVANYLRATYSNDQTLIDQARKQIVDRQYSRRTYLGLTNG